MSPTVMSPIAVGASDSRPAHAMSNRRRRRSTSARSRTAPSSWQGGVDGPWPAARRCAALGMRAQAQPPTVNSAAWAKLDENAFHSGASWTESTLHPRVRTLAGSGLSLRMKTRRHIAFSVGGDRSAQRLPRMGQGARSCGVLGSSPRGRSAPLWHRRRSPLDRTPRRSAPSSSGFRIGS
jgi:hypothetical protein